MRLAGLQQQQQAPPPPGSLCASPLAAHMQQIVMIQNSKLIIMNNFAQNWLTRGNTTATGGRVFRRAPRRKFSEHPDAAAAARRWRWRRVASLSGNPAGQLPGYRPAASTRAHSCAQPTYGDGTRVASGNR